MNNKVDVRAKDLAAQACHFAPYHGVRFTMLVITRKAGQTLYIGDHIKVTVVKTAGNAVRIGIDAPDEMSISRGELLNWLDRSTDVTRERKNHRLETAGAG